MTRRTLLRMGPAAAAAAAVAVRCSSPPPSSPLDPGRAGITGAIVGASHATGHRLREGGFPEPRETRDVSVERPDVLADGITRFLAAAQTAYNSPRYAVWNNDTAVRSAVLRVKDRYRGFWGPYVGLTDGEKAPFFEMPPLPWDRLKRPSHVDAQKRAFNARRG